MMTPVRLTVILSSYNGASTIARQLDRLSEQQWSEPWEIVVSDNGSTDGTHAVLAEFARRLPHMRVVDSSDARGLSHALNVGVRAARGDHLLFCDEDDEVGPGWVAAMGDALGRHAFVAGRLDHERLNEPWTIGVRGQPQSEGLLEYAGYFPFAFSANMGVRRSAHDGIGGFDEALFTAQDMDYCWRLQAAGIELTFVPAAVVHYRHRGSMGELFRQARQYAKGNVELRRKHYPLGLPRERSPLLQEGRRWLGLVRQGILIRNRSTLGKWCWDLGWRLGHVGALSRRSVVQ